MSASGVRPCIGSRDGIEEIDIPVSIIFHSHFDIAHSPGKQTIGVLLAENQPERREVGQVDCMFGDTTERNCVGYEGCLYLLFGIDNTIVHSEVVLRG